MDILMVVSNPDSAPILVSVLAACRRRGTRCGLFFTNDGVKALVDSKLRQALPWADQAIVCEHSWHRFMADQPCPVQQGSQTDNSLMVGQAAKILSL